ncbi:MAG: N-6 DNA methylase [Gammaproteobacteria bacterium AqS3]|nr:N-6 DNA methylase [Gammaproteobacteria bacterium AqS3]
MATTTPPGDPLLEIEPKILKVVDHLRDDLEPSKYKEAVLDVIFLRFISSISQPALANLGKQYLDFSKCDASILQSFKFPEPDKARWFSLKEDAEQIINQYANDRRNDPDQFIGKIFENIKRIPRNEDFGNEAALNEFIHLISSDAISNDDKGQDFLARIYEHSLAGFTSSQGVSGGEYFTPRTVARTLIAMIEPYQGKVYDPCFGSGGMFIQSKEFIERHGRQGNTISIYGQEIDRPILRRARMNLALQGIDAEIRWNDKGSFLQDEWPDLEADYILASPPFNMRDWDGGQLQDDPRWIFGVPPVNNANFAWLQHIYHRLAPDGVAGVVLAADSLSSNKSGQGKIRRAMIEANIVDAVVRLPGLLFYSSLTPACLWILSKNKKSSQYPHRSGEILIIDARDMGSMTNHPRCEFSNEEIGTIAETYKNWRSNPPDMEYEDIPNFCRSVKLDEIRSYEYVLTPNRYLDSSIYEIDELAV